MKRKPRTPVRTRETQKVYEEYKRSLPDGCPFCNSEPIKEYEHWRLVQNDFPYDAIAERHCLLVPKEHIGLFDELSQSVKDEYANIIASMTEFDALLQNFPQWQTIPDHFHVHLFTYKVVE